MDSIPTQDLQVNMLSQRIFTDFYIESNPLTVNPSKNVSDSLSSTISCHLKKKVIIPPNNTVCIAAISSFNSSDNQFLFEHDSPTCGFQSIITANLIAKPKSNKNPSVYFTVAVINNSEGTVHIKKIQF